MPILGLMSAESFASERFKSVRRSVYYYYPNGAAPLMGILSLLKEEVANDPEFKWYEKRMVDQSSLTVAISTTVVVNSTVSADFATWTTAAADFTIAPDSQYGVKVASTAQFRVGHLIRFNVIVATVATEIIGRVTNVDAANTRLAFIAVKGSGANLTYNAASSVGQEVLVIGSAHAEGQVGAATTVYNEPINPSNYTQIFRTPYQITGTALKTAAKFDENGIGDDQAEEASLNHMQEMEKNFLFGEARQVTSGNATVRYTGGILYFLRAWEAANSIYRGGAGAAAITSNNDENKRIIALSNGYLSHKLYSSLLERAFRHTSDKANEKLILCGSGFLSVINQLYESRACLEVKPPTKDTFGMDIVSHVTPFGTVHYKTHPLFTRNASLRNNALILDVGNLKYRYIEGRDTTLLEGRQPNNADYREDEWLTESGLELQQPESCMYITNVLDFQA